MRLTDRQWQVLWLFARGATMPAIAKSLGIGVSTAHTHLDTARHRMGVPIRRGRPFRAEDARAALERLGAAGRGTG